MNHRYRSKLHSTLCYLYWRQRKGMGNFTMIPKINDICLWNWRREGKLHTRTHSPCALQGMPSLDVLHSRVSIQGSPRQLQCEGSEATTDKRELTGLRPVSEHSSHRGPHKYLGVQKQMVLLIPPVTLFHSEENTQVTSVKVCNRKSRNSSLAAAINNTQSYYAILTYDA